MPRKNRQKSKHTLPSAPASSSLPPPTAPPPTSPSSDPFDGPSILIRDYGGDVRSWNSEWESMLEWLYGPSQEPLISESNLHEFTNYVRPEAFEVQEKGRQNVLGLARELYRVMSNDYVGRYVDKWKGKTDVEREEIVLAVLAKTHEQLEETSTGRTAVPRGICPEVTLHEMAGGGGVDFVRLLSALLLGKDHSTYSVVPNAGFDRLIGVRVDDLAADLPRSNIIRAYQEDQILIRHSYLLSFVLNVFRHLARLSLLRSHRQS